MQMQTGQKLMKAMPKLHLRDRTRVMKWITTEEFKNIMTLNEKAIKLFFDAADQPLRSFPKHNPFKRLTGTL
jgi:hypothetical protein